jgi:aminopeptidase N
MTFEPPLSPEWAAEIVTTYSVNDPPAGIIWTPESPAWPGRPAQLHSQGESNTNSYWFPCHDFPNVKLTTELVVTVPEGYWSVPMDDSSARDRRGSSADERLSERAKPAAPPSIGCRTSPTSTTSSRWLSASSTW